MYKAIKNNKIIALSEKKEIITHTENGDMVQEITGDALFPCLVFDEVVEDTEHKISDYVMAENEFVLNTDTKAIEKQKENVRGVRNSYLEKYVDPKQLVLVWETLSEEDKEIYKTYRQYLLDYPESSETWYEENPKTFEEWSE